MQRINRVLAHLDTQKMADANADFNDDDVVIISACRTPMGSFQGNS